MSADRPPWPFSLQFLGGLPPGRVAKNRRVVLAELGVQAVLIVAALITLGNVTKELRHAGPPPSLPPDQGSVRFGLREEDRRAIFVDIASHEPSNIAIGVSGFPGQPWSQEDHRCAMERGTQADLARRHRISLTQAYLILDEGIRQHWPGPDGKPLNPKSVPLQPRKKQ
ncbi:MAG: hypothetical protein JNL79_11130 [Myxococcales bacterium]|nr:hypothetical protein [Myxococcales bacterium]